MWANMKIDNNKVQVHYQEAEDQVAEKGLKLKKYILLFFFFDATEEGHLKWLDIYNLGKGLGKDDFV